MKALFIPKFILPACVLFVSPWLARAQELKKPAPVRITLSPQAQMRLTETLITRTLEVGMTNTPCDSVLSPKQCFDYLVKLPSYEAPHYTPISLENVDLAFDQIDSVLKHVVSRGENAPLWSALRTMGVQARETIAVLAREGTLPTRNFPQPVLNLYREAGIARLELKHRVTFTGNLFLVDTTVIDRTSATTPRVLLTLPAKSIVDMTESLRAALASGMPSLAEFATKETAAHQKAAATPSP